MIEVVTGQNFAGSGRCGPGHCGLGPARGPKGIAKNKRKISYFFHFSAFLLQIILRSWEKVYFFKKRVTGFEPQRVRNNQFSYYLLIFFFCFLTLFFIFIHLCTSARGPKTRPAGRCGPSKSAAGLRAAGPARYHLEFVNLNYHERRWFSRVSSK